MSEKNSCLRRLRNLSLFTVIIVLSAVVVASIGVTYWRAMALVHPPRYALTVTPADYGLAEWTDVSFTTEDGLRLDGWFFPPAANVDGATIVCVHGIGHNRTGTMAVAVPLIIEGYGALFFDLRNHGTSEGHVTSLGYWEVLDVQAALDFVRQQPGVNADRIGLLAHSMGTAPTLLAAARDGTVAATLTMSAYTSLADNIADGVRNFTGLPAFPFAPLIIFFGERATGAQLSAVSPIDEVAAIAPGAVFFMHGAHDQMIAPQNSERLYAAAQEPKQLYIVPDGTHDNFVFRPSADIMARVSAFFTEHLGGE